jgi:hypothetical protein
MKHLAKAWCIVALLLMLSLLTYSQPAGAEPTIGIVNFRQLPADSPDLAPVSLQQSTVDEVKAVVVVDNHAASNAPANSVVSSQFVFVPHLHFGDTDLGAMDFQVVIRSIRSFLRQGCTLKPGL